MLTIKIILSILIGFGAVLVWGGISLGPQEYAQFYFSLAIWFWPVQVTLREVFLET
jgi:hypothetical protein